MAWVPVPEPGSVPDHPSPGRPPLALHWVALGTFQLSWADSPVCRLTVEAVKLIAAAAMEGTTSVPVLAGSRTDLMVRDPVLLVVSAVEFHTAAREVKSATPLLPLGAAGGLAGQVP